MSSALQRSASGGTSDAASSLGTVGSAGGASGPHGMMMMMSRSVPIGGGGQSDGSNHLKQKGNMMMKRESSRMSSRGRQSMARQDALDSFIATLRGRGTIDVDQPGFVEGVREHFEMLPSRYATNVNTNSLDVLNHKRLLDSARSDPSAVSFQVRSVDVMAGMHGTKSYGSFGSQANSYQHLRAIGEMDGFPRNGSLPRPAFGSSPNLQALVLDAEDKSVDELEPSLYVFYEVTIASVDQSKLLMRLSESLSDIGLNICEAHAFNTKDRFVLDVFLVNGWQDPGGVEALEDVLSARLQELPPPGEVSDGKRERLAYQELELRIPKEELEMMRNSSQDDDWEIDPADIAFHDRIASGAFGDLFKGVYCGQDVAIKILRGVHDDSVQYQEFLQEVAIMRKVRHRNVVQFIGACTKKPHLCIVFEYMKGGSVYDHLRNSGTYPIQHVLRTALEVCRGMDYLHKKKILHRDLKAANLLIDEHGTVKIADFGVARVIDSPGVMTAETGTYRWMAPEVIEHKPYGEKADVYSFGIVIWELLTGKVPYSDRTPLQAAVGVVQSGLRPEIPPQCPAQLADIMRLCWQRDPSVRPSFETLKMKFEAMYEKALEEMKDPSKDKKGTSLFGRFGRPKS